VKQVHYTAGYRYQLEQDFIMPTGIKAKVKGGNRFVQIDTEGLLILRAGYATDGATNAPDMRSLIRGSFPHDGLYQLIRLGVLEPSDRKAADRLLHQMCLEDGMPSLMAWAVYRAVRSFGGVYMRAHDARILTAP
jgi:hypothetical protein